MRALALLLWITCATDAQVESLGGSATAAPVPVMDAPAVQKFDFPGINLGIAETCASSINVFDIDNDGDLDVLACLRRATVLDGTKPVEPLLVLNDGSGRFELAEAGALTETEVLAIGSSTGDFDGDGDIDVLLHTAGGHRFYRNESGRLDLDEDALPPEARAFHVGTSAWAPMGPDGEPRLVLAGRVGHMVLQPTAEGLVVTQCDPSPSWPNGFFQGVPWGSSMRCVDVDQDGDKDLVWFGEFFEVRLLRNEGDGTLNRRTREAGIMIPELRALADLIEVDLDCDGTEELLGVLGPWHPEEEPSLLVLRWDSDGVLHVEGIKGSQEIEGGALAVQRVRDAEHECMFEVRVTPRLTVTILDHQVTAITRDDEAPVLGDVSWCGDLDDNGTPDLVTAVNGELVIALDY